MEVAVNTITRKHRFTVGSVIGLAPTYGHFIFEDGYGGRVVIDFPIMVRVTAVLPYGVKLRFFGDYMTPLKNPVTGELLYQSMLLAALPDEVLTTEHLFTFN